MGAAADPLVGHHRGEASLYLAGLLHDTAEAIVAMDASGSARVAVERKDATTVRVELLGLALHGTQHGVSGYLTIHREVPDGDGAEKARPGAAREQADRAAVQSLTPRQIEVLQALADGRTSRQIANDLYISVRTVQNHIANILRRLGVHRQLQALVMAIRYDVVKVT